MDKKKVAVHTDIVESGEEGDKKKEIRTDKGKLMQ